MVFLNNQAAKLPPMILEVWDFTLVGREEGFTSPQWTEALGPAWKVLKMLGKYIDSLDMIGQYDTICIIVF